MDFEDDIIRLKTPQKLNFQNPESILQTKQTAKQTKLPFFTPDQRGSNNNEQQTMQLKQQQMKVYLGHLNLLYMYLQNTSFYQQLKNRYPGLTYLSNQEKRNLIASGQLVRLPQANKIVQLEVTQRKMLLVIHGDVQYLGNVYKKGQCFYSHPQLNQQSHILNYSQGSRYQIFNNLKSSIMKSQMQSSHELKNNLGISNNKIFQIQSPQKNIMNLGTVLGSALKLICEQQEKHLRVTQQQQLGQSQQQVDYQDKSTNFTKIISVKVINKASLLGINYQQFQFYINLFQQEHDKKCLLQKIINPLKEQGRKEANINITSQVIKRLAYRMKIFQTKDNRKILNPDICPQFQVQNTIYDVLGVHFNKDKPKQISKIRNNTSKCIFFLIQGTYTLFNKNNQPVAQLENTYAGQQILWNNSYDFHLKVKSIYAKYGVISKEEFLGCVSIQVIDYLKTIYQKKIIQRNRVQRQHQIKLNLTNDKKKSKISTKLAIHQKALQAIRFKKSSKRQPIQKALKTEHTYEQLQQIKQIVKIKVKQFRQEQLNYTAPHNRFINRPTNIKTKRWPTSRVKSVNSQQKRQKSMKSIELSNRPKSSIDFVRNNMTLDSQSQTKKQIQKIQRCKKSISASAIQLNNRRRYQLQKSKSNITLSKVRLFDYSIDVQSFKQKTYYQIENQFPSEAKELKNMKRWFKHYENKGPHYRRPHTFR